ncbi:MAG: FAD-dependent oxidoreductase [Thermoleophilum sp.]|nr:FAD-dependent oxidoreductase [Thermoleophilum sp.]
MTYDFDIAVIGAGNAGCEAALAAARLGAKTVLLTMNCDTVAQMSCNPAIGGVAKGQIVREIDALGGEMGRVIDATGIQFRMLNRSKGAAMHSPRAQADKRAYHQEIRRILEEQPGLSLRQETVEELIVERQPDHPLNRMSYRHWAGPGHKVDRVLREGDEVAGFRVLHVPGHSAGHIALWREHDGVLILGDVVNNIDTLTGIPGLYEPKAFFTPDPAANRRSARRLGELEPRLVLFGHGAPLRDTAKFVAFCSSLA